MSTHGVHGTGLAQAATDHLRNLLTAANALLLRFPIVTSLPVCFGMDSAAEDEPIGLPTVVNARGGTWVIGGYQMIRDRSTGWIVGRTYELIANGVHLIDALRVAQLAYLDATPGPTVPADLRDLIGPDPELSREPWFWSHVVVGPLHPASWSTPA